jgi:hypothetical protein
VAEPWWVNLAVLIPAVAYFCWRRSTRVSVRYRLNKAALERTHHATMRTLRNVRSATY